MKDYRAQGGNPCLEQTLESYELCCLVETFPANHESLADYLTTLKARDASGARAARTCVRHQPSCARATLPLQYAFLYAKTVTLGATHWPATNAIMMRNRRIGCSMSGIAQFIERRGLHELKLWCEDGYESIQRYDRRFSQWLAIPQSIKTTCVKPSGTVSLLAGATPGVHHPEARHYLRRVRIGKTNELVARLRAAGYHVEPACESPDKKVRAARACGRCRTRRRTLAACAVPFPSPCAQVVVTFPVEAGHSIRTLADVGMWEQFALAAFMQRYWADNQVSCTVTFDPVTEGPHIPHALEYFQYQLKARHARVGVRACAHAPHVHARTRRAGHLASSSHAARRVPTNAV